MSTRRRLLDALNAIARSETKVDARTGFAYLAKYVPRHGEPKDAELVDAFKSALKAMTPKDKKLH